MQLTLPRIVLAICASLLLGHSVDASYACNYGQRCEGPVYIWFSSQIGCEGSAIALPIFNTTAQNPEPNMCLPDPIGSKRYTCGNGELRITTWLSNQDCSGEPSSESVEMTHKCMPRAALVGYGGSLWTTVCNLNDTDPVSEPQTVLPNPDDPMAATNEVCPNGVCRAGFASMTVYNESNTCNGASETMEVSEGQLGICYRVKYTYESAMTICYEDSLRTTYYAGTCGDDISRFLTRYRRTGTCSLLDPTGDESATEIFCPTVTQKPSLPAGRASSMSLPILLAVILLATTFLASL